MNITKALSQKTDEQLRVIYRHFVGELSAKCGDAISEINKAYLEGNMHLKQAITLDEERECLSANYCLMTFPVNTAPYMYRSLQKHKNGATWKTQGFSPQTKKENKSLKKDF